MRRFPVIVLAAVVATAGAVVAAQVLFRSGTLALLRDRILPDTERHTGWTATVAGTDANLLRRQANVTGLRLAEPGRPADAGMIEADRVFVRFRAMPLLRGRLDADRVAIGGGHVAIVRRPDGGAGADAVEWATEPARMEVRTGVAPPGMADRLRGAAVPSGENARSLDAPDLPSILLRNMSADARIQYTDHVLCEPPLRLAMRVELKAMGLSTLPGAEWGTFHLTGSLADDPNAFVTCLSGRIAPYTDWTEADFDADGTVGSIAGSAFGAAADAWDIAFETAAIRADVVCRRGRFRPDRSRIRVTLHHPRPRGKLARKVGSFPLPRELTLDIPLGGTLDEPELDIEAALARTLIGLLTGSGDGAPDSGGDLLSEAIRGLGGLFDRKKSRTAPDNGGK